jgi:hypothetical protein
MTQMAAMSFGLASKQQATRRPSNTFQVPPIQQVAISFLQQTFLPPASTYERRGGQGRGRGQGGHGRTPFTDHMRMYGAAPAVPPPFPAGGGMMPSIHGGMQMPTLRAQNPDFSNIYKRYNDWNVCFSCGFDVEDGHTSLTCPFKKANHQTSFVRENAQQFIAAGYNPCTRGMHKTVLPLGRST